ncbi:TPA: ead/Ea22-like family protein [Citrobacter braakii]
MTALNKQALRQLAEKATPSPWEMEHENIWFRDTEGYTKHLMYAYQGDDVDDQQDHDNTAYIAAFNPKVVLALLDELEAKDATIAFQQHEIRTLLGRLENANRAAAAGKGATS